MIVGVLTAIATSIGLAQALALLDQTRKLRRAGSAREVSVSFLTASLTGNVIWLTYGMVQIDLALLIVNAAGLLGASATLVTALRLRARAAAATAAAPAPAAAETVVSAEAPDVSETADASETVDVVETADAAGTASDLANRPHARYAAELVQNLPNPAAPHVEHIRLSATTGRHPHLAMLN
jgi:uncharacterized protein with PQ loop repeat